MEKCAIATLLSKPLCDCFGHWHIAAVIVWVEALALSTNTGQLLSKLKWNCESTTQSRKGDMHETRLLQHCGTFLLWGWVPVIKLDYQTWKNKATTSTSRRFLLVQSSNPKATSQRIHVSLATSGWAMCKWFCVCQKPQNNRVWFIYKYFANIYVCCTRYFLSLGYKAWLTYVILQPATRGPWTSRVGWDAITVTLYGRCLY